MLKTILLTVLMFSITACGNNHSPEVADQNVQIDPDSLQRTQVMEKTSDDSIRKNQEAEDEPFWSSSYMSTDNFSITTGYLPIDKLKEKFDKNPNTKSTLSDYAEYGDCGYRVKTMKNDKKEILHYRKGDCGEYGFSNTQYYLQNDSLRLIRMFSVGINTWPDEPEGSTWKVEETVHIFNKSEVLIKNRELIIDSDRLKTVFSIREKPFKEKRVSLESIYEEKKKQMIFGLEMKPDE